MPIHRPVVWVTGASRGIGREIAKEFALIGCVVCVTARSANDLKTLVAEIRRDGGRAEAFPADLTRLTSIAATVRKITRKAGPVEVLINNAGVTVFKTVAETSMTEVAAVLQTNLIAQIACTKAVLPAMMKRKSGWIVNILSRAATRTFERSGAYAASKAGLHAFARVAREELRPFGIKVVNVLPGPTETEMWSAAARKKYSSRMMRARSVAETVTALYQLPPDVVVDDIVLRPIQGDID